MPIYARMVGGGPDNSALLRCAGRVGGHVKGVVAFESISCCRFLVTFHFSICERHMVCNSCFER